MASVELIATAPMGLEALVAKEVKDLGYIDVTVDNGAVTFQADEAAICRANLWLRTADRVLVKLGEFPATTFEELFQGTRALPWDEWIPANGNFHINGRSHKSQLSSVPASQGVVEKAIVERLKQKHRLEWFPKTGALYSIEVSLLKDVAMLTMDTTGPGLHKRGYRKLTAEAPIKETLAAALIELARWHPERPFWDPMCGSGTIPIEAALIGHNIAPGIHRQFSADGWERIGPELWQAARDEALDLADYDKQLEIIATDVNTEVLELATYHLKRAGLTKSVTLRRQPLKDLKTESKYGYLITNPPYGERLGEREEVERLYRELGRVCKGLPEWSVFVITAHKGFERYFGRGADKKRKLYNGRIECDLYQYHGKYHARPVPFDELQPTT
ncbi:MAG TPA: class I SAM-dependent RNA methyltransferase [Symbiobacteriaceae bacterium]|nr:class I SAM-dependent RNA methyltransferase [Symbiobacteriaceae bacterium]